MSLVPAELARHYSRFRVADRLLLTGHSHQAWPDVGYDAQQRAWIDAAELVDDKWERAFEEAARVQAGFRRLLNDTDADVALGQNTHELVTRLLSALPLGVRPRLITSDGEFHTIRRQLDRLREEGLDVVSVAARPAGTLSERLTRAIDDKASCVLVSSVLYETAEIVPGLNIVASACARHGSILLVDDTSTVNLARATVSCGYRRDAISGPCSRGGLARWRACGRTAGAGRWSMELVRRASRVRPTTRRHITEPPLFLPFTSTAGLRRSGSAKSVPVRSGY
jgi:hypothetical protein